MGFTGKQLEEIRDDINLALKQVGEKHGLGFELGGMRYTEDTFKVTLEAVQLSSTGGDVNEVLFKKDCYLFGFRPEHYGIKFKLNGTLFSLIGFNPRSPKNNCKIVRVSDGAPFKCSDLSIKRALQM